MTKAPSGETATRGGMQAGAQHRPVMRLDDLTALEADRPVPQGEGGLSAAVEQDRGDGGVEFPDQRGLSPAG